MNSRDEIPKKLAEYKKSKGSSELSKSEFGTGKITNVKPLGEDEQSTNEAAVITFDNGQKGFFKPSEGMMGSTDSELLASKLSDDLGWDLVPKTIPFEVGGKKGSLQEFVSDAKEWDKSPKLKNLPENVQVFDALLGTHDRNKFNLLYDKAGKVKAIDNDSTFGAKGQSFQDYNSSNVKALTKIIPNATHKKLVSDLNKWRNSPKYNDFASNVSKTKGFEKDTLDVFNKNIDLLTEWAK